MEFGQIEHAVKYCIELEAWELLTSFTDAMNDYLIRRARWDDYIKFNTLLLAHHLIDDSPEKMMRIKQVGELEEIRGNYKEALSLNKVLFQLYEQDEKANAYSMIEVLKQISKFTRIFGDYDETIRWLEKGLELAERYRIYKDRVDFLFDLAVLYKTRDVNRAQEYWSLSLETARMIGYRSKEIDILILGASLYLIQNNIDGALRLYQAAFKYAQDMGDTFRAETIREELTRLGNIMKRNIFISYNHQDRDFVERLANDLRSTGLPVWWDQWEIKVGDSIIQKVSDGISDSAYLLAVLSPHSIRSQWVQREISSALMNQLSIEKNIVILPLLIADCEIPVLLREIKWADFRKTYEIGLKSLLEVLASNI
ncbi:MAG: toll/interleukin-1 receptor domain-containing protein [Chloroflexi bacterium]|nr:toll/interleukin-1 receptor domain-containing protein [Chloroflexota bacterium]